MFSGCGTHNTFTILSIDSKGQEKLKQSVLDVDAHNQASCDVNHPQLQLFRIKCSSVVVKSCICHLESEKHTSDNLEDVCG